jgi:hypothetical protein
VSGKVIDIKREVAMGLFSKPSWKGKEYDKESIRIGKKSIEERHKRERAERQAIIKAHKKKG